MPQRDDVRSDMRGRKLLVFQSNRERWHDEDERPWLAFDHVERTSVHPNGLDVYVEGRGSFINSQTGRPWLEDSDLCILVGENILVPW